MAKKTIFVRQHDITDCGAACLASVAAYYRLLLPIARIRQFSGTNKRGTTVLGLVEAAHKLGFQAKGVKGTAESLRKIPKPAIAHVIAKERLQHYVVIYEVTPTHIQVCYYLNKPLSKPVTVKFRFIVAFGHYLNRIDPL